MNTKSDDSTKPRASSSPQKKPYYRPVLASWRSLRDLTLAVGRNGNRDGGRRDRADRTRA